MQRFDQYGPLDTVPKPIGDKRFIGVNMRVDPGQLPAGYVAEAINMRFRNGVAETRKGFVVLAWINKTVDGNTQPWGEIHGAGVFSDPFTLQEYIVIAADGAVYYTQPNNAPQQLAIAGSVTLTGEVSFTQAFDVLLMHRGPELDTLEMPRISEGFTLVDQSVSGTGTHAIPNATDSLFLQNRLFIPNDHDEVAVSDLNDYTRYVPIYQEFKVNQGSADELVAIFKFNDTTIVAFKEHSIYVIGGVYGNLAALQQDELTSDFGLVARRSIAHVGPDLWFLSELGVMSIAQTDQNKLQGVVLPVSDPIQPLIDRINWTYAANAVSAVWDSKYYLAVPLDDAEVFGPEVIYDNGALVTYPVTAGKTYRFEVGYATSLTNGTETLTASAEFTAQGSTIVMSWGGFDPDNLPSVKRVYKGVNNAVLVYDFLNGAWAGHDQAPGFAVRDFKKFTYNGAVRLFALTHDGYLVLYEEDFEDQLPVPYTDVTMTTQPTTGTIRVNGGTTVSVAALTDNSGTNWGNGADATQAAYNLYADQNGRGGYAPNPVTGGWTAPGTMPVPLGVSLVAPTGVRFYATNGVIPSVTVTGTPSWATVSEVGTQPVVSRLVTRGYGSDVNAITKTDWMLIDFQTWAPNYSITVISPGVKEEHVVAEDQTFPRENYFEPSDLVAFEPDNDNGDFLEPYRKDYSLYLGEAADATPDFALHTVVGGVEIDLHQEHRTVERVNVRGRHAQIVVTNSAGRIRVMSIATEVDELEFNAGTQA